MRIRSSHHVHEHGAHAAPRRGPGTVARLGASIAAAAVVGLVLPTVISGSAAGAGAPAAVTADKHKHAKPAFAGYSASAWASPMQIEIYEPTIPIPTVPQGQVDVGYTNVLADSTTSHARASYLWPGDAVGEGFKTIVENLGFPPEIADPIAAQGYPVQVNAASPGGPKQESQEPTPGMIQRASAGSGTALAENGFSGDNQVSDDGSGSGSGSGSGGGLPGLPPLPLPLIGGLGIAPTALTGTTAHQDAAPAAPSPAPGLPPAISGLVDAGDMTSVSRTINGDHVYSQGRASVSDVQVLGGLVTIDGVKTNATAKSDGKKGTPDGKAVYGDITALGQKFTIGPDGVEAVGQAAPIPGLPDNAAAALKQIGLKITVPKATLVKDGDRAVSTVPGLILDFDLTTLRSKLNGLPIDDLVNLLPDLPGQASMVKSAVQAAAHLSPRIVVTLAPSSAAVDTSQPIALPPLPTTPTPTPTPTPTTAPTTSAPAPAPAGNAGPPAGSDPAPTDVTPPGDTTPTTETPPTTEALPLPVSAPVSAGLPPLFSIPGILIYGGLAGAIFIGSYARRLGLAALGGGSSCPHGLQSGLPDLRKV